MSGNTNCIWDSFKVLEKGQGGTCSSRCKNIAYNRSSQDCVVIGGSMDKLTNGTGQRAHIYNYICACSYTFMLIYDKGSTEEQR